jgi:hypothetical protein
MGDETQSEEEIAVSLAFRAPQLPRCLPYILDASTTTTLVSSPAACSIAINRSGMHVYPHANRGNYTIYMMSRKEYVILSPLDLRTRKRHGLEWTAIGGAVIMCVYRSVNLMLQTSLLRLISLANRE